MPFFQRGRGCHYQTTTTNLISNTLVDAFFFLFFFEGELVAVEVDFSFRPHFSVWFLILEAHRNGFLHKNGNLRVGVCLQIWTILLLCITDNLNNNKNDNLSSSSSWLRIKNRNCHKGKVFGYLLVNGVFFFFTNPSNFGANLFYLRGYYSKIHY